MGSTKVTAWATTITTAFVRRRCGELVVHREYIKAPGRRLRKLHTGQDLQVISNDLAKRAALLTINSGFGGLHVVGSPRLNLDEAEYFFVPTDEVDFPMVPRRAEIPRNHDIPAPSQIEISFFFAALSGSVA